VALSRRTGRPRVTLLFLVLTSVTVITLDARGGAALGSVRDGAADALAPLRDAAGALLRPVGDALSGLTGYGDLEAENEGLRARVAELEGQAARAQEADRELEELHQLRGLSRYTDLPTVTARVVGSPISNFEQTVELDKGGRDGVAEGMPVATGAGLLGRVVDVSDSRSVVRLVTDAGSAVGVRLSDQGETGIATGEGPDRPLSVGFIEVGVATAAGDLMVTSGVEAGSGLPPGIPVGRVARASSSPGQLEQVVELEPLVDLRKARLVEVVLFGAEGGP
jgi:rod shape-determining protein MreC